MTPRFEFDEDANGYLSEEFEVEERALVHVELASRAPVVILKQESDGGWANYGQTPKSNDGYEVEITSTKAVRVKLATPVEVRKCWVMN